MLHIVKREQIYCVAYICCYFLSFGPSFNLTDLVASDVKLKLGLPLTECLLLMEFFL